MATPLAYSMYVRYRNQSHSLSSAIADEAEEAIRSSWMCMEKQLCFVLEDDVEDGEDLNGESEYAGILNGDFSEEYL